MSSIGDPVIQPIPAVGTSGTSYASQLVDFLNEVKDRLEAAVPLTSILVSLLDMANNAVANLSYLSLYEQDAEPSTPVASLQNFEGNLWWVSDSGAAQLTSGNSLNAAAISGIGGDYGGANPASFRFSDADEAYYAYDDFGGLDWAWLGARGLNIYGAEDSTTRVRLTAAAGVANMTITFPAALPAGQRIVQIEADGDLVYSNTLPANTGITMSGTASTAKLFHGSYNMIVPIVEGGVHVSAGSIGSVAGIPGISMAVNTTVYVPIFGLDSTKRIVGFSVYNSGGGPLPSSATYSIVNDIAGGTFSTTGVTSLTVSTTSSPANASGTLSLSSATAPYLKIVSGSVGSLGIAAYPCYVDVTYDSV